MALIGIDARMYGPQQTGIGTYIEFLVQHLARLQTEHRFVLFMLPDEQKHFLLRTSYFALHTSRFMIVPVRAHWYSLAEQTQFLRQLYRERLDLVHFTHFNVPVLYRRPFVVTIHDLTPKFFPGHKVGRNPARRLAYKLVLNHAAASSRRIIAPSEFTKRDIVRHFKVRPEKVSVIYEGVKDKLTVAQQAALLAHFESKKQQAFEVLRREFKHTALKKPFIFYVGVWRDHKNVVGLIKAFDILVRKYRLDLQLVIGGKEDPFYPEVRRTWEALGLSDRVYAPGMVFGPELNAFYRASQLFCLPSFYEGFGLVAVEALNQGTPVAASKFGPVPEVIADAGRYFDPADMADMATVMAEVLKSPALQQQLVAMGQQRIAQYDWQKMAEETIAVYEQALAERKA